MILKLIGMIVLGILSGVLSYYNKNYYVRLFDDILGRDQEENTARRVGRGFFYGFLFPIYFVLILTGLIFLIAFLIVAGIIAAIVFVLVWVTEKILPNESTGNILLGLYEKVGLSGPARSRQPMEAPAYAPAPPGNTSPTPPPSPSENKPGEESGSQPDKG
jgi:type IV secretory pathway VirB3-like protein